MQHSYFDDQKISDKKLKAELLKLKPYRNEVNLLTDEKGYDYPESSLYYLRDEKLQADLKEIKEKFKKTKYLLLIGIGGSSLGTEAIHQVLDKGKVDLIVLDTISPYKIENFLNKISRVNKAEQIAVCVISKSGNTTETLANSSIVLERLQEKFAENINSQIIFIGDKGTRLEKFAKKNNSSFYQLPKVIGGRYSLGTAVGLIPLTILGFSVEEFIAGYLEASNPENEEKTALNAARTALYFKNNFHHYNFFAFDGRLEKLGAWYRQLFAESLGKEITKTEKTVSKALVPTISTPADLHSIGQLYFSGVPKVYTDFVLFKDEVDYITPKNSVAGALLKNLSLQELASGLYNGVVTSYNERNLPYRTTILEKNNLAFELGVFIASRLREVMYTAFLLEVNAFDQPNVELYKLRTKEALNLKI